MKLLIVDDSNIVRRLLERSLSSPDFEAVKTAQNGRQAMEIFAEFRPDLVTMDITMPELDGLECVSRMTRMRPGVKILVISALGDRHTAVDAVKRGAGSFLLKPVTAEMVVAAIRELYDLD